MSARVQRNAVFAEILRLNTGSAQDDPIIRDASA